MNRTSHATTLRELVADHRAELDTVLSRYRASNPRIFGSAARGDARPDSDIDLLVDLDEGAGNELLRVAGIGEELSDLLGVRVDVVTEALLRDLVSASARPDLVAL